MAAGKPSYEALGRTENAQTGALNPSLGRRVEQQSLSGLLATMVIDHFKGY